MRILANSHTIGFENNIRNAEQGQVRIFEWYIQRYNHDYDYTSNKVDGRKNEYSHWMFIHVISWVGSF